MSSHFTPERIIGPDVTASVADVLARHIGTGKWVLVCDDTTWVAAGEAVYTRLGGHSCVTPHSLGRAARPLLSHTTPLMDANCDGFIAVGSGTINDVTKLTAARLNKPYISIATAASMNGYTSANASLEEQGAKHSYAASPPRAVIADLTVLAAAPRRMARAGLGDTLCRNSVEPDMLMSHLLLDTPYPRALFDRMRAHEADLIANAAALREGNPTLIHKLMEALLDAGDAMREFGSSAPASQGEHMIAHTAEMLYGGELRKVLHGEMIAVTSSTMSHLQQKMLLAQPTVKPLPKDEGQFLRLFGKQAGQDAVAMYQKKLLTPDMAASINARIAPNWLDIKAALLAVMLPSNAVERAFIQSGNATRPTEIGMSDDRYRTACTYAFMTRDRFTFLDLAVMNDKRI
ncbi:MAG: iron-containing alcohol dehydrogenase [Pseudomonadota bacterium]